MRPIVSVRISFSLSISRSGKVPCRANWSMVKVCLKIGLDSSLIRSTTNRFSHPLLTFFVSIGRVDLIRYPFTLPWLLIRDTAAGRSSSWKLFLTLTEPIGSIGQPLFDNKINIAGSVIAERKSWRCKRFSSRWTLFPTDRVYRDISSLVNLKGIFNEMSEYPCNVYRPFGPSTNRGSEIRPVRRSTLLMIKDKKRIQNLVPCNWPLSNSRRISLLFSSKGRRDHNCLAV